MKTKEELTKKTARIADEEMEIVSGGLDDLDKRELESGHAKRAYENSTCSLRDDLPGWEEPKYIID